MYQRGTLRLETGLSAIHAKKDCLLEMSIVGAITIGKFKKRNDGFNDQMQKLENPAYHSASRKAKKQSIRRVAGENQSRT